MPWAKLECPFRTESQSYHPILKIGKRLGVYLKLSHLCWLNDRLPGNNSRFLWFYFFIRVFCLKLGLIFVINKGWIKLINSN